MTKAMYGLAGIAALLLAAPVPAETLPEAIATAYATNPVLAAARARQEALAEEPNQRAPPAGS